MASDSLMMANLWNLIASRGSKWAHTRQRECASDWKKKSFGSCTINPEKFDCNHDWVYLWFSFCSSVFFDPSWCLWTVPKASENRSETPSLPLQDFIILSLSLLSLSPEGLVWSADVDSFVLRSERGFPCVDLLVYLLFSTCFAESWGFFPYFFFYR